MTRNNSNKSVQTVDFSYYGLSQGNLIPVSERFNGALPIAIRKGKVKDSKDEKIWGAITRICEDDFIKLSQMDADDFKSVVLTAYVRAIDESKEVGESYNPEKDYHKYTEFIRKFINVCTTDVVFKVKNEEKAKRIAEKKKEDSETVKSGAEIAEENYTNELNAITAAVNAGIMTKTEGKKQVADLKKKYGK